MDTGRRSARGPLRGRLPAGPRGIGLRIAIASALVAVLGVAILALGVMIVGGDSFMRLMTASGHPASDARAMFDASVTRVVAVAILVAVVSAAILAAIVGQRLARPLRNVGSAARRIADGDYAARVPREGPEEIMSLADSFNQMAASLEAQEHARREFIANAAHELRTPLTNLQGYLEALRDEVILGDRATFESLWDEAERLVRLSRSLDVLADGDASGVQRDMRELDLSAAVRSAVELAGPALGRAGLEVELDVPDGILARADPDHLAQVLGNLLQNAERYTPRGGRVIVRAERRPGDALVTVSNTGTAIPAEDLPHVFERFYRVEKSRDRARGGAGIGLAIVKQLVEGSGGTVGVDSRDGQTGFWFSLPGG